MVGLDLPFVPKRILLIRLKAIGDVLLCTPLIRALRKKYPAAQIDFAADPVPSLLLQHNSRLNHVLVFPKKGSSFFDQVKFIRQIRQTRYDLVLDLFGNPRSAWMTLFSGAPLRAGYAYRGRKWVYNYRVPLNKIRKYQVEVNLDVLRYVGIPDDGLETELYLSESEKNWGLETLRSLGLGHSKEMKIGLNPTGTWSAKRWLMPHWRELILLLNAKWKVKPLLFWGPGDEAMVEAIRGGLEDQVQLCPETDLRQSAALISGLDLLIGNDGAPQHMAQALGTPSLTIFGPTWGLSWTKPSDPRHQFLQHFLDCGPCDQTLCPLPERSEPGQHTYQECLALITPAQVLEKAHSMLSHQ